MTFCCVENVQIDAVCGCVPANEIDNHEFGKKLFGEELENIILATGIEKRRICKNKETTALDLSVNAAEIIFNQGGINKKDIGGVVFVTFTPDNIMPCNAALCQHRLELSTGIPAFDVNLACSGYPYGLWVSSMMAKSLNRKILLLDGDKQSHIVSSQDESTALLFSDAGSASIISPSDKNNKFYFSFMTDGSKREVLSIEDGGSKNWFSKESLNYITYENDNKRRKTDIYMDGFEVFKFVVQQVPKNIKTLLSTSGIEKDEIDFLVLHQANKYMVRQIAKALKIGIEKVPMTMDIYGNSSSATIPITLASGLKEREPKKKDKIIMSGFGAGLSIGSAILDVESGFSYGVHDYEE
jgi:3-oxoacyl-[acyl-carrier-protein] synthase-3